jgi:hypothetical protein
MSEPAIPPVRTPWHLWVVGVLSLLWNAVGAFDFVMTQTRNESYMSNFTPEQLEYFYGFPAWVVATWGVATCGSLLGSVLLLLRSRFAVPVNLVVVVAMAFTFVHNLVLSDGLEIMGGAGALVFTILILVVGVLLWIYARAMASRGVLR